MKHENKSSKDKLNIENLNLYIKVFTVLITIITFLLEGFWYANQLGYFHVFQIDKSYLKIDEIITIYSILSHVVVSVILITFNVIVFVCALYQKYLRIVLVNVIEMFVFFIVVLIQSNQGMIDIIKDIYENKNAFNYLVLFLFIFVFIALTNVFGVVYGCFARKEKWTRKDSPILVLKSNIKVVGVIFVVAISLFAVAFYLKGTEQANNKTDFKVIIQKVEEDDFLDQKFKININDKGVMYYMYATVYENEDIYLACQMYYEDGKYGIVKNNQIVLKKENIRTFYMDLNQLNKMKEENAF